MCVVKVTRVESDLLAQSTRHLRGSSSERPSTPPLTSTPCHGDPDPEHADSQTPVMSDEVQVSTNPPDPSSESEMTMDVTLNSQRTAESSNQTLIPNCESASETSAPSIPLTSSPPLSSSSTANLFSESESQQAKIETDETTVDISTESGIDCGTSALYKEQSSIRLDSDSQEHRTNSGIQHAASFSEMPLLTPEVTEERVNPPSLAPEMPSLTLAVQTDCTKLLLDIPNTTGAPVLHQEKSHLPPSVITADMLTCSESADWSFTAPQEHFAQSHNSDACLADPESHSSITHWEPPEKQFKQKGKTCSESTSTDWSFTEPQERFAQSHNSASGACLANPETHSSITQWEPPEKKSKQEGHEHTLPSADTHTCTVPLSEQLQIATNCLLQCSTVADLNFNSKLTEGSCPDRDDKQTSQCLEEQSTLNPFVDSKPFTSTIWKNLNSQNPAVLIESLQPELAVGLAQGVGSITDYVHDSLSYTMWSESNCQREKSADSPNSSPCMQAWGNLEPGSTQGSGSQITPNLPPDLQKVEADKTCVLGEQTDSQEPQAEEIKLQEYYEGVKSEPDGSVSDSDSCESRERGGDSSSESSDENAMSDPECGEAGLEPGEVCTVSSGAKFCFFS